MRSISFALTTQQFRDRTKTVTRRKGWRTLKAGDRLRACVKCMGLRKGEHPEVLGTIEVVSVGREQLSVITPPECVREGFPGMTPDEFVGMFCDHMGGPPIQVVTRIEFCYVEEST